MKSHTGECFLRMSTDKNSEKSTLQEAEEKLTSAVHTGADKVSQLWSEAKDTVGEKYKEWTTPKSKQEEAHEKAQEAKEEITKAGEAIKQSVSATSEAVSEKVDKVKEDLKE